MTTEQFYSLDEQKQAEFVWDGIYMADRHGEEPDILYKNDCLFIEDFYHRKHTLLKDFRLYLKRTCSTFIHSKQDLL